MPQETRDIVFSQQEFRDAAAVYLQREGGHNIAGELVDIILKPGAALSAFAEFKDTEKDVTVKVRLGMADLGALLTLYCINRKIPLPRGGERSVRIVEGNIALMINIPADKEENRNPADGEKEAIAS